MNGTFNSDYPPNFKVTKVSMSKFLALNGHSVSFTVIEYPAGAVNPPHAHPNSSELLFAVDGLVPKRLVHYQYNSNPKEPATALFAFGNANAGNVSIPATVFATGIDDNILAKAFKTDVAAIKKINAGLAAKS